MFDDARTVTAGSRIECDVAIVGTGAAGVALASELIDTGLDVVVLESGGFNYEPATQELYRGEVDDTRHHGPLTQYRRRMFGGTTTVWGGRCAPFDAIDFEKREYVPHSGWPVTRVEMDPYYARAHMYTHTGEYSYDVGAALPRASGSLIPEFDSDLVLQDRIWRFSLPTDFGKTNRKRLEAAPNVRVFLHANVLKVTTDRFARTVESLPVSTLARNAFTVKARRYALATGGLEATRLLLVSNDVIPAGLGSDHDVLGRFYGSHIAGDLGEITFTPRNRAIIWNHELTRDGVYCKRHLRIADDVQRRLGLLNFRCVLTHLPFGEPGHRSSVLSAAYLVKRSLAHQIPPEFSKDLASRDYKRVREHVRNLVLDAPSLATFGLTWLTKRILSTRKLPSIALHSASNTYTIHFDAEQAPNPDSRVVLSNERDVFGIQRLKVQWRYLDLDIQSVVKCYQILREELEGRGTAKMHLQTDRVVEAVRAHVGVGSHHIGTTRMSSDPRQGVVNRDCRVHGVDNLYISSPSVFCTVGYANPGLTITAFALRLADHLKATI